ncbi:LysR substrate-binding domain-containing protein [Myxococcus xanthus]|uniref:LysR substrate-binding domain-containing protein n=1 Tax=Myxococcus xanthus TaxID=34 RepID=UPI001CEC7B2E|nr:LysR substrate-binding domain-containing protein [Myxococcus xanthus]
MRCAGHEGTLRGSPSHPSAGRLHRQHHPKPRLAGPHSGICLACLLEWHRFDERPDVGEDTKRSIPSVPPALLRQGHRLRRPSDLGGVRLIHDRSVDSRAGFATWDAWLEKAGGNDVEAKRGLRSNNSAAVLQAAIDGQGVALARSIMAHDDLAAGRLVRLFPEVEFPSRLACYVVYRPACATLAKLVAFREWLVREASERQALSHRCR